MCSMRTASELGCRRGGLTQALAKQAPLWSPNIVEFNDLVTSLAKGHMQKMPQLRPT